MSAVGSKPLEQAPRAPPPRNKRTHGLPLWVEEVRRKKGDLPPPRAGFYQVNSPQSLTKSRAVHRRNQGSSRPNTSLGRHRPKTPRTTQVKVFKANQPGIHLAYLQGFYLQVQVSFVVPTKWQGDPRNNDRELVNLLPELLQHYWTVAQPTHRYQRLDTRPALRAGSRASVSQKVTVHQPLVVAS